MKTYAIHEDNLDRLKKRIQTIQNKCIKYGSSFHFAEVGEEFRTHTNALGDDIQIRYVLIEAEGQVVHNDWEFIAVVEHKEAGNVIRQFNHEIEVPEKYYYTDPICEHCNTKRRRKDTYLIHNTCTDEWKQVGKSCLTEFTNGMDAEEVAKYISLFDCIIQGEAFSGYGRYEEYYPVEEILCYAIETVKHFGYQRSSEYEDRPTRSRCMDYFSINHGSTRWMGKNMIDKLNEEMDSVHFEPDCEANKQTASDAIDWVKSQDDSSSYVHNLKVICASSHCASRDLGILISLAQTYRKHIASEEAKEQKKSAHAQETKRSSFVGSVGDRITFDAADVVCICARDSIYGVTFMYKFHDNDGNVLMWSTGTSLDTDCKYTVTGTIKNHEEFNGVKQTWLTRCKATKIQQLAEAPQEGTFDLDEVMRVFEQ